MEPIGDFLKTIGALHDETRVLLIKFIDLNGPLCVCDMQESFNMSQPRLSRHLKILKEAGFLRAKRCGRWIYFEIRTPMDRFRSEVVEEIRALPLELPKLIKISKECEI